MKNVMIDLETLATTADAVILSIGAVRFDLDTGEIRQDHFYRSISIESNLDEGRRINESTLKWWLHQSPEAQQVFHENKTYLTSALTDLSFWLLPDDVVAWSNGADFDLPILAHAYAQLRLTPPWKFWNTRCLRTYRNLPGAKEVSAPANETAHNALSDAIQQAQHAIAIHQALFGEKVAS